MLVSIGIFVHFVRGDRLLARHDTLSFFTASQILNIHRNTYICMQRLRRKLISVHLNMLLCLGKHISMSECMTVFWASITHIR